VIVAQFGEPIADKTNAEKRLPVTPYPKLTGSWNWKWDQWRRRNAPSTETESG
jgi:Bacterial Ig domain